MHSPLLNGPRSPRSGFTLVELSVAIVVLTIAILSAMGTVTTVATLTESSRESAHAYQAARFAMESLKAEEFRDLFAIHGSADGTDFHVEGLTPQTGDGDGACGRILLPSAAGVQLREDVNDPSFSLPMDLNGDGSIDGDDHAEDYVVLPVRVRIEWAGKSGDRLVELSSLLSMQR